MCAPHPALFAVPGRSAGAALPAPAPRARTAPPAPPVPGAAAMRGCLGRAPAPAAAAAPRASPARAAGARSPSWKVARAALQAGRAAQLLRSWSQVQARRRWRPRSGCQPNALSRGRGAGRAGVRKPPPLALAYGRPGPRCRRRRPVQAASAPRHWRTATRRDRAWAPRPPQPRHRRRSGTRRCSSHQRRSPQARGRRPRARRAPRRRRPGRTGSSRRWGRRQRPGRPPAAC